MRSKQPGQSGGACLGAMQDWGFLGAAWGQHGGWASIRDYRSGFPGSARSRDGLCRENWAFEARGGLFQQPTSTTLGGQETPGQEDIC